MVRPTLFACALASLVAGCTDHELAAPRPNGEGQTNDFVALTANRKADILFVIDNSLSMKQEQENLARNFPAFIERLRTIEGGLPDVHIAVVTTDLGAGPAASGCHPGGDGGLFQGWDKGCGLDGQSRFISASDGERTRNYHGDLSAVFGCMARVGTDGCGYEHQLAAAARALDVSRTPQNAGFLRDDAYLQLILITDEDDCSADDATDLFTRSYPGDEPSFRCSRVGHRCQGQPPGDAELRVSLDSCQPADDGPLSGVRALVDQIRALKKDSGKILVSGIFGWPTGGAGEYRVGKSDKGRWDNLPVCDSGNGEAAAGLRLQQFVKSFGDNGSVASICDGDFKPALDRIGHDLASAIGHGFCMSGPLVDTGAAPGLQPECLVSETRTGQAETYLPHCDPESTRDCWTTEPDASCTGTGLKVVIRRKEEVAASDATVSIKCRTCTRADDGRCPP
jgi:hypothetical protein